MSTRKGESVRSFIWLGEIQGEGDTERQFLTPIQMPTTARCVGHSEARGPKVHPHLLWMPGTQVLGPLSAAFPCVLGRSCIENGVAGI